MPKAWPELASSTSNQISFIEVLGTHLFQDLGVLTFLYTSLLTSDPALCSVVIISYNSILHFFKFCMYTCITHKICIDKFPSRKSNCLFWKVVFVQQFSCIYQLETDKTSNKFFFDMQNNAKQGSQC